MAGLLSLPLRAPRSTLAALVLITAALGFFARSITVDSAIENLLPEHDADRVFYEEAKRAFGSEEATVIGVFADDVFAPRTLERIDRLSRRLEALDGAREVISLTTMKGVEKTPFGVRVGRLMRALPRTAEEASDFRARVLANPVSVGNLVSADAGATLVLVLYEPLSDRELIERDLEGQIRRIVAETGGPEQLAITGLQTLKVHGARRMERDLAVFMPLSVLVVLVVLALEFRTIRGVLLPLGAVLTAVVWTLGVIVLTGRSINMGTLVLPPLLMAIGIAYAIHIVSRYYQEARPGRAVAETVSATMEHVRTPVAIAALTTLLGFAVLTANPIRAIHDFGAYSLFGITATLLVCMTFLPAALALLPLPVRAPAGHVPSDRMALLLEKLGRSAVSHRGAVLAVASVLCLLSLWGAARIRVETDYLDFFSPRSSVRLDNQRIAERLGGTQPLYVVIDGDSPQSFTHVETLRAVLALQTFIEEQPGVDASFSLADYLSVVWGVLNPDAGSPLPDRQADVEQLLQFVDRAELRPVVTSDFARANVIVRTRLSGSSEVEALVRRIEARGRELFRRGIEVRATGAMVLLNRSADTLARSQILGLAQVLAILAVLMSLLFLSIRAGLLSLVPNLAPIVILFGVMGWGGVSLNISTSMIAVIAIGIAVDDTIHYLSAFNAQVHRTGDQEQALMEVGRTVGRPIVFTSIALAAGFLVVCLSSFQPIRHFGILAGVTMVVALFADLLVTPALVMSTRIVTLWDLLYVKLGPQPHREIPLFAGLRPFQAKIVVLMGRLAAAPPGAFVTRRGELKPELYVLLSGRVEVRRGDSERVIRSFGRGDVIGEMGLVRERPRTADVVVAAPTEYLVLDRGFLERLQRRYPRIAAKVFLNLTRILSDRVESTTDQLIALTRPADAAASGARS